MKRTLLVCLALIFALGALPSFAGTLYVPILSDNGVDGDDYVTRIWITNEGNAAQVVETLMLPMNSDGTLGRDDSQKAADKTTVRGGETVVLEIEGKSGMLEIASDSQAAEKLAVNAELRNTAQDGGTEAHATVPIISSANMAEAGDTVTLQGMRRTVTGVFSNLVLANLGHDETQCTVKVFKPTGAQISGTALLTLKALSQVQFADALNILGESQIRDVNARITCDQPFFAYISQYERSSGEVIFVRPSSTADSALSRPGNEQPSVPGAVLFTQDGTFHIPAKGNPTAIFNIPVPADATFSNVVVDFDFYNGGWFAKDPGGLHSIVWLHRGACCWPKWAKNITTFANAFGPSKNGIKMISNMEQDAKSKGDSGYALQPGQTYHVHFEYDTTRGKAWMAFSQGGQQVAYLEMPTTAKKLVPDNTAAWMIYFGHEDVYGQGKGAERATYGWKYENLRVEFLP